MKAQITLKSGVTVVADVDKWTTVRNGVGQLTGFKWVDGGAASLMYLNIEDVSAVVVVDEPSTGGEGSGDVAD